MRTKTRKMHTSVRLRRSQLEKLRSRGQVSSVIAYALRRLGRGDFTIDRREDSQMDEELVVVPFYGDLGNRTSHEVRLAVDAHLATRDEMLEAEISKARLEVDVQWARLRSKGPYIMLSGE